MYAGKVTLTGIKPTGTPHVGNYVGAIKPALNLAEDTKKPLYFIADHHALTIIQDKKELDRLVYEVAATWLACGLDPNHVIFYRQSDVPEIFELTWILSCLTPKRLMNRAHAYKAAVQENEKRGAESDTGVNMGLYCYPILMAADILAFDAELVPVGKDQVQHVEIARDIAQFFNNTYGRTIVLPDYKIDQDTSAIPGLDGRKMSKSYNNTIPLFAPRDKLRKLVMRIVTDSSAPNSPKDPDSSPLFALYSEFATSEQASHMRYKFEDGIMWGDVKKELFEVMDTFIATKRQKYQELMNSRNELDRILQAGAERARPIAQDTLFRVRRAIGVRA